MSMSDVSIWFLIPLTLASLLGILINSYILLVVLFSRQYTSVNNLLLLHLGTLNLCLGATFLIFSAPGLAHDSWLSDGSWCHLHGFLFTTLHPLILWSVCGLNADRYYAIAAPLHYGHLVNPKKVFLCLAIGWIISLTFTTLPFFHIAPFAFNRGLGACVPNFQSGRTTLWYSAAYTAFTLLLPVTLIICCNVKILMIARYHRHRIASAIYEVTLSAQVTITHQRNPFFVPTVTAPSSGGPKFRSRSPVSTVLQLLGSFVILYVPYYSIILWESCITFLDPEANANDHVLLYQVVLVLLTLSPTINGFLYGLKNKNLRKTFQNYWRKKVSKSEVNQEIQARTPSTCGSRRQSLTPLGFFARPNPNIQRRLSEALLDVHKDDASEARMKIKRIASEITWRPKSQSEISMTMQLQVPKTSISDSECSIDNAPHSHSAEKDERTKSFIYKLFGIDENKAPQQKPKPKILITRALSEDDYSRSARERESNQHSLTVGNSFSKWYHHSDYNLVSNQTTDGDDPNPNAKTKLLADHLDNDEECSYNANIGNRNRLDLDDSDNDYENSENTSEHSDNSSGLYMNLDRDRDSFDTLRTNSCDIDMQDLKQIESIEAEFACSSCSCDEDVDADDGDVEGEDIAAKLDNCKHVTGNGGASGSDRIELEDIQELKLIKQQEVVL